MSYSFPKNNDFKFYFRQKNFLWFKKFVKPSVWINENFYLGKGYVVQGKLTLYKFQEMIVDLILKYNVLYLIGPTQTGKSLLLETLIAFFIDNIPMHMMLTYENEGKSSSVFRDKLKTMIKEIKALRKYWSGYEDDLTNRKITLDHLIMRIGHAGVRSKTSISSFAAPLVIGDELSNWPKIDGFNQIDALLNRTQSSLLVGKKSYAFFCTSPKDTNDISYVETHKPSVLFLRFFFVCPHCKKEIQLVDRYIREIPNEKGEKDHDPDRIKRDKAAYIECPECLDRITEDERKAMILSPRLYPVDKNDKLKRKYDKKKYYEVAVNWNRLIFPYYSISQCLSDFFKAQNSNLRTKLDTYRNETMAEWIDRNTKMIDQSFLRTKSVKYKYKQHGGASKFPSFVKILIAGIDTQDNGFYLIVRGYGLGMESILIREKFIQVPITEQGNENLENAFEKFYNGVFKIPYIREDGYELPISFGFIDRGGHRAKLVDYICLRMPWLNAYIGSTYESAPLIQASSKGKWYLGNTKALSRIVHNRLESDYFHVPVDYSKDYELQIFSQYDEEYIDSKGNKQTRWIDKQPNHFRDCENMCEGMIVLKNIQNYSFSEDKLNELEAKTKSTLQTLSYEDIKARKQKRQGNFLNNYVSEMSNNGW